MADINLEDTQRVIKWNEEQYGLGADEQGYNDYNSTSVKIYRENDQIVLEEPRCAGIMQKVYYDLNEDGVIVCESDIWIKSTMKDASAEDKEYSIAEF